MSVSVLDFMYCTGSCEQSWRDFCTNLRSYILQSLKFMQSDLHRCVGLLEKERLKTINNSKNRNHTPENIYK